MLKVTCAIIVRQNKILVTQRGAESDHPLQWEFPGGKIHPGESPEECIKREICEELAIEIDIEKKMVPVNYDYGRKQVELIPFLCRLKPGKIKLNEHVDFKWGVLKKLQEIELSAADRKLIQYKENLQLLEEYFGKQVHKA